MKLIGVGIDFSIDPFEFVDFGQDGFMGSGFDIVEFLPSGWIQTPDFIINKSGIFPPGELKDLIV